MKNFIKKKIENLISIHRNNTIINSTFLWFYSRKGNKY